MYDSIITLISEETTTDECGDQIKTRSERIAFAELKSIGQSEFYQAQALGLKPEIKFVLPDYLEYHGEKILRFRRFGENDECEYSVLRTYQNNNELELVCARGVNNECA